MVDKALRFANDAKAHRRGRGRDDAPRRGAGQRQRRVAEELRHILARVLRSGECRDPVLRDANITVTEVRISPDLRNATAYVMPLGGADAVEVVAALLRSAGFLRGLVTRDLGLRYAPALAFALDETFDQASRISALLARPEVERDLRRPPADGETGDDAG
jgi:ribosome-binding factor A